LGSKSSKNKFNEAQNRAVSHGGGPLLVLAGPGSGKTSVIIGRVRFLIEEKKISPGRILVVTFSRAAAGEMKERFFAFGLKNSSAVTFGTFHSFFFGILRTAYGYEANQVASEEERMNIMLGCIRQYRLDGENLKTLAVNLLSEIAVVKEEKTELENYYSVSCAAETFRMIYRKYEEELGKLKKIDYEDMLLMTHRLLSERKDILDACSGRFQWILVDEFQDINRLQYEIVRMIAGKRKNLTAVGDDDQSIYGFRGARPEIMLGFQKDFPEAERILLDRNYRSTPEIVQAAGRLISCNTKRFPKAILAVRPHGSAVRVCVCADPLSEVRYITGQIKELKKKGLLYRNTAILYRTNLQPRFLIQDLMSENIPFRMKEALPDLMDHWIAKDFAAYLLLAHKEGSRRDVLRICNRPNRFIRREALQKDPSDLNDVKQYYKDQSRMLERIRHLEYDLRALAQMDVFRAVGYIRKEIGYDAFLSGYAKEYRIDAEELLETADEIMESGEGFRLPKDWLDHGREIRHELSGKNLKEDNGEEKDAVNLMTFHASKGLEFPAVFIMDANEGITPYRKAVTGGETEEERRMFYVAMTRAADCLEICTCKKRFRREAKPSVFLSEIRGK